MSSKKVTDFDRRMFEMTDAWRAYFTSIEFCDDYLLYRRQSGCAYKYSYPRSAWPRGRKSSALAEKERKL